MIHFDVSQLTIEIVQLKSITTALGGSMMVVDEALTLGKKEVLKRLIVPTAPARAFIQSCKKITRYLKPVEVAVVRYGEHVVALERHPHAVFGELRQEMDPLLEWKPMSKLNIEGVLKPLMAGTHRDWYFDGRYIYAFKQSSVDASVQAAPYLTQNGQFRKVIVDTFDTQCAPDKDGFTPEERSCLAFVTSSGKHSISPPIWKDLNDVGGRQLSRAAATPDADIPDDEEVERIARAIGAPIGSVFTFDTIDEQFSVNLNFALKAGQELGKLYGYESVEPLQLSRLMIELHTVNLPNVPAQVKSTFDINMKFTHALAWLLGMSLRANTLETHIAMRALLKYLTKRGIFRSNAFDESQIFKEGNSVHTVPLMSLDQLLQQQDYTQLSLGMILEEARRNARQKRKGTQTQGAINGMAIEE